MSKGNEWWKLMAVTRQAKIREYTDRVLRMGSSTDIETVKRHVHQALKDDGWFEARIATNKRHQWDDCEKFYSYKGASGNHTGYHAIIQGKIDAHKALQAEIYAANEAEAIQNGGIDTSIGYVDKKELTDGSATAQPKKTSWAIWLILGAALLLVVALFKRKKS